MKLAQELFAKQLLGPVQQDVFRALEISGELVDGRPVSDEDIEKLIASTNTVLEFLSQRYGIQVWGVS
jgi:hypothetical protein